MLGKIQSPAQELRFTRSGQASLFWVAAAVLAGVAMTLLATGYYRDTNPQLPNPAWAFLPLICAGLLVHTAVSLTRHAYLILTPLGIEIFPFFRAATGMRLVVWQEIHHAETNAKVTRLTLHHDAAKSSGIHLSLAPIRADRRTLLAKAVIGRLSPASHPGPPSSCVLIPDRSSP
jgi:lysylphosphatidylglycerol synthetase-like protein (DUF2156 family)